MKIYKVISKHMIRKSHHIVYTPTRIILHIKVNSKRYGITTVTRSYILNNSNKKLIKKYYK